MQTEATKLRLLCLPILATTVQGVVSIRTHTVYEENCACLLLVCFTNIKKAFIAILSLQ